MSIQNTSPENTPATPAINFAGFSDWFEIFEGGEQTAMSGEKISFTEADLDSVVSNFTADSKTETEIAPLVIGHPKTDSPAWGWVTEVKREGNKLFAKANDVVEEFESAVKKKMYPKRSISLRPDGKGGYRLRHIGFLGANPPAVKGLAAISFAQSEGDLCFEQASPKHMRRIAWALNSISRVFRKIREREIEQKGIEDADQLIPEWEINELSELSREIQKVNENDQVLFSAEEVPATINTNEEPPMDDKKFSQADLDAAVAAAQKEAADAKAAMAQQQAQLAYSKKLADAKTIVAEAVNDGRVTPAEANGLAEFMANLPDGEATQFEFAESDGKTKSLSPMAFFKASLAARQPVINFGLNNTQAPQAGKTLSFAAPDGAAVDEARAKLHAAALQYAQDHKCDYITAVRAVEQQN